MGQPVNKLVRDRVPEIIQKSGKSCQTCRLSAAAYRQALRAKLVEEAWEAAAEDADLVAELADLCEVMDTLIAASGLDWETVRAAQSRQREERGGFALGVWLLSVEA